ncbi:hypothetical protein BH09BAC3_BH09BAC3_06700 [soil metagenome]
MNKLLVTVLGIVLFTGCGVKEKQNATGLFLKTLISPAKAPSGEPYLFTDEKGTVYLSWIERDEKKSILKYSLLAEDQWSKPALIDSGNNWFVNWADFPMLATNGHEFVAHYLEANEENNHAYDIKLTASQDGQVWETAEILHDDGKQAEHGFVSLLPYGENFFVAWLDGRNASMEGHDGHRGEMSLRAAMLDKSGKKINEWELDSRVCDCCQTSAAISVNGPVVVYRDRSDEEIRDMAIVRLIDGQWTKPKTIHADNWKIAGCPVNGPRVAAQGNKIAMAWFSMPEGKGQVSIIFSSDGGESFGQPIHVEEGNAIGRVDVVMLGEGEAVVSWMEGSTIKAAKVTSDGVKYTSLTIASSSDSRSSGFPQMTRSDDRLIFAWTDDKDKTIKVASMKWQE